MAPNELGFVKGAPRLEFLAGRPNATAPAIEGLVPEPQDSVNQILDRFADAVGLIYSSSIRRLTLLITREISLQRMSFRYSYRWVYLLTIQTKCDLISLIIQ